MLVRTMATVWLLLAGWLLAPAAAGEWKDPTVAGWAEVLESPDASPEERAEALEGLREAARGQPREETTREAILALANLLEEADQREGDEAVQMMKAAAAYYPDDPRSGQALRRLGLAQIESGESLGAHFSLVRLFQRPDAPEDPDLRVRAAANAVEVGDAPSAVNWLEPVDPEALPVEPEQIYWLTRLKAAAKLDRFSETGQAVERLDELDPALIRSDAAAMLAAARSDLALGRLESAADRYQGFVNIHTRHAEQATALFELGKILVRLQRTGAAMRTLDWILADHPFSPQADLARLERVAIDPDASPADRAAGYRLVALELRQMQNVAEACKRILETLLAAGAPLEAISTLGWMAKNAVGPSAAAAREQLVLGLEPILAMLVDQQDDVGLAAAAAEAESVGVQIPRIMVEPVARARRGLGLDVSEERALEEAQAHARDGRWTDAAAALQEGGPQDVPTVTLLAETAWREGRDAQALEQIEQALEALPADASARSLLVLRADIRLASGEKEQSCPDYLAASRAAASPWVSHQLTRCGIAPESAEETAP